MKQLKRANIITLKNLRCNDARSYQRPVNRVADGSRFWYQSNLMMRSLGHQRRWLDHRAGYCSLVNPSMKSKLDFNQNSKAVDFETRCTRLYYFSQKICCLPRASSLLISPHYSTAADPYLPPAELRFLRKFQPFRIDGSTKWFTRIFGPRRESGRDPTLRGRPWSAPHLRLRNCSIYL